ncbi:polysaccharide deacetylase family protein [Bacillus sp. B190/17]|uniref:Polysaccharide deacetylase family protein n=1 Tax=Bacillus lumedeiriae TaxID=3058829 RepID=A0ABW8I905_9BACI
MNRLSMIILFAALLLIGCQSKASETQVKTEHPAAAPLETSNTHPSSHTADSNIKKDERHKKTSSFEPKATISITSHAYHATSTIITTTDRTEDVSEIAYHIWRTADGPASMKKFSAKSKDTNFAFLFDIKEFRSQRGEYQVEAYSIHKNGKQELLARSTLTFQQRVPILMYHAVDEYKGTGLKGLFVTPANFEAQMRYLKDNGYTLLTFERWKDVNKVNKPVFVTFDDGMKNNMTAFRILQTLKDDHFQPAATEYVIAARIDGGPPWLSTENLKEMVNSGIFSVQSHTMTHADLTKTTNYREELYDSKQKIEQITGKPVIAIAYPFGHFDDTVVEETKKYYHYATATKPGLFIEKGQQNERLLMQRVRISYSTTLQQFAALLEHP